MTAEVKSEIHSSNGVTLKRRPVGCNKLRLMLPSYISEDRSNEVRKALLEIAGVNRAKSLFRGKGTENSILVSMRFRSARMSRDELIELILETATTKIAAMKTGRKGAPGSLPHSKKKERYVNQIKEPLAA